ncbi:MAG: dethiobiotin synthase, partial [Serpentinimonas sp.]|nr:dethiobiotin synthase [Serpentinimonas sp.]
QVGPLHLRTACAPHIAAALEGKTIEFERLQQGARQLAQQVEVLVAEGAGGLCVPLGPDWDSSDLMRDLGLPRVLGVGLRLGCINHALLTAEAIRARGLRLGGWVANTLDPDMPFLTENLATLQHEFQRRYQTPCLGVVPWLASASAEKMARAAAAHLDDPALRTLFELP